MQRRIREINGSYVLTLPKQVCELYNYNSDDIIDIEPIGNNELRLRKL